jgi:hypothetical protein
MLKTLAAVGSMAAAVGYSATPDRFMLSNPMTVNRYVRRAN